MIAALFVVALAAGLAGVYIGRASVRLPEADRPELDAQVDDAPYYGPVRLIGAPDPTDPYDWNRAND